MARYDAVTIGSPEAARALISGLQEWARGLPWRGHRKSGKPAPANKWCLGPERNMIRAVQTDLVNKGQMPLAGRVRSEMADLLDTTDALDDCCAAEEPDPEAEQRLADSARIQVKALAHLLSQVWNCRPPLKKARRSAQPPVNRTVKDETLMRQWEAVSGKGGMTRKEFCAGHGLTLKDFIRAQDRWRKRTNAEM